MARPSAGGTGGVGADVGSAAAPVALVTGAASGMGYAVATRFLDAGWTVLALDLREPRVSASRGNLGAWASVDVRDRVAVREAVQRLPTRGGPLRAVVCVAGIYPPTTLEDLNVEPTGRSSTPTSWERST
jgi:NAD(P)-dependent dehydrogenase (short-subunit alcohol dehydrogenase family)